MSSPAAAPSPDVRTFTVGPVQENAHIVRAPGSTRALLIDPGEEPQRLIAAIEDLGVSVEAILITHCHFDHIGAVAPLARATGAPVYCPAIERPLLSDIMRWVPYEGFGPYESYEADHTLSGGERLSLAGLHVEVLFTPGHSPGHLTYAISPAARTDSAAGTDEPAGADGAGAADGQTAATPALLSGDVLFQGSVGRVDLPGGDWPTLERSIGELLDRFPPASVVHPGHMGATTLGRELATNPFLAELRAVREPARS
ncbi:MAG TPA: MBL fold metallo-hydrolase [Solirubrobacteraceae bacterium]|nr:MBL fold metallo-hydrolase [Solirubrobacteraceae bacterium]